MDPHLRGPQGRTESGDDILVRRLVVDAQHHGSTFTLRQEAQRLDDYLQARSSVQAALRIALRCDDLLEELDLPPPPPLP